MRYLTLISVLALSGCVVDESARGPSCAGESVVQSGLEFCVIIEKGFLMAVCPPEAPERHEFDDALVCAPAEADAEDAAVARAEAVAPEGRPDGAPPISPDAWPPPFNGLTRHDACSSPFPEGPPPLPMTRMVDGRPRFDEWRDLDCDALRPDERGLGAPCGGPDDAECEHICLRGRPGGRGVCTYGDIDIWCDGEGEVVSYWDGDCWMCMPSAHHAMACCLELEGFDCRAWPFPSDGRPGTPCAIHEDCEPGLVCGAHRGSGYGICQCPELDDPDLAPAAEGQCLDAPG